MVLPAGMVIDPGTVARFELLDSETTRPPAGAAEVIETVPFAVFPPLTVEGLSVIDLTVGGLIVSVALFEVLPSFPVIDAVVRAATGSVLTVNVAFVLPAPTVTVANTVAEGVLLESVTLNPPDGAGLLSFTVPTELAPPATVLGTRINEVRVGALIVRVALADPAFSVAVIVADF